MLAPLGKCFSFLRFRLHCPQKSQLGKEHVYVQLIPKFLTGKCSTSGGLRGHSFISCWQRDLKENTRSSRTRLALYYCVDMRLPMPVLQFSAKTPHRSLQLQCALMLRFPGKDRSSERTSPVFWKQSLRLERFWRKEIVDESSAKQTPGWS